MQLRKLLLQPSSPLRVLSSKYPFPLLQKCSRFSSSSSSSESQIPNSHSVEPLDDNRSEHASTAISIDRSGLYNPPGILLALVYFICIQIDFVFKFVETDSPHPPNIYRGMQNIHMSGSWSLSLLSILKGPSRFGNVSFIGMVLQLFMEVDELFEEMSVCFSTLGLA